MKSYTGVANTCVFGVPLFSRSRSEALENVKKYLVNGHSKRMDINQKKVKPYVIVTPNAEIVVYAKKHPDFLSILKQADMTLPDGMLIVWANRILMARGKGNSMNKIVERIAGVDFMKEICTWVAKDSFTVGLIGGFDDLALNALECLRKSYPGLSGWAMAGPNIEIQNKEGMGKKLSSYYHLIDITAKEVEKRKTDILFVGFGHPKQEYIINYLARRLQKNRYNRPIVLMAVGGAFDFISGRVPRAPVWMRNNSLEWLYRLIRQPWRWRRQIALIEFIGLLMKEVFIRLRRRPWL